MKTYNKFCSIPLISVIFILFLFLVSSTAYAVPLQNASCEGPFAYVTNPGSNTVSIIDTANNNVTDTVNFGSVHYPCGVAFSPDGTKLYVTNRDDNYEGTVSVIDTATNDVTATINVGNSPRGVAVTPDRLKVYVANDGSNTVSVIDTATNNVTATINVGSSPGRVAVNTEKTKIYASNYGEGIGGYFSTFTILGNSPEEITVSSDGKRVYVADACDNNVSVIDTQTNNITAKVNIGSSPRGVAVSPDGTKVYVTSKDDDLKGTVSIIDTATNNVTVMVNVGCDPEGLAVTPDSKKVYVAISGEDNVSVIDTVTNNITASVNVGLTPYGVAVTPDGKKVYVTNNGEDFVSVIDTTTNDVTATERVGVLHTTTDYETKEMMGSKPSGVAVTPDGKKVYVANTGYFDDYGIVSIIDTATNNVTDTVNVGSPHDPYGVAVSPDGKKVYITKAQDDNISVIDTATNNVTASMNVGWTPYGVAVSPDGNKVYVTNEFDVSVIDTTTNNVSATVDVGVDPFGITVTPDGKKVYVAISGEDNVSVIDTCTNKVIATVPVGSSPRGVAVTPDGKKVYVTNSGEDSISVINTCTNKVIATVPVGSSPRGVAVTPDGKKVYVANFYRDSENMMTDTGTVSVIDTATNRVQTTVSVELGPQGVSVTSDGKKVYVANQNDNTISVIDTDTNKVIATIPVGSYPIAFGQFIEDRQRTLPLIAAFTAIPLNGNVPLKVTFTDVSTGSPTSWQWDFGDGSSYSTMQNPIHNYPILGTYRVNLTVSNNDGSSQVVSKDITLSASSRLTADFETKPIQGSPLTVQFTDKSTNASEWHWDFGDGSQSTEQSPEHTYTSAATFNVMLTASDGAGVIMYTNKSIEVKVEDNSIGNRIWEEGMPTTYTWNAQSFSGFYYDLDTGVSAESMTINNIGRSINERDIKYVTSPALTKFEQNEWGTYQVLGFMADKYFAGYTEDSVPVKDNISPISDGILSKILIDSDDKSSFRSGETLTLKEGYSLIVKKVDINGNSVLVDLEKDGKVVDESVVALGGDYIYKTNLDTVSIVPIIIIHFSTVFTGGETSAVTVQGIFQISDNYNEVKNGDIFGEMEVKSISSDGIKMENSNDIRLSRGDTVDLMDKIKIQVADGNILRFAPVVDTSQADTYELRGTVYNEDIENNIPTWTPLNFEGFYYNIDEGIGTEKLMIKSLDGNTIPSDDLVYQSIPQVVNFKHSSWGNYTVVGFMTNKYFAGYPDGAVDGSVDQVSLLSNNILSKILIDSDETESLTQGSGLALDEGYFLGVNEVDVNGNSVWVQLKKDGKVVDDFFVSPGQDYIYITDIGKATNVPHIIIHFGTVFSGQESAGVFVQGIFQISDNFQELKKGDTSDKMEVTDISDSGITMKNSDDVGLSRGEKTTIMNNVSFMIADSSTLRFYPCVEVQSGGSSANGLNISVSNR